MTTVLHVIDADLLDKMAVLYGEGVRKYIHFEDGSFSMAALNENVPVGFISAYTETLPVPLSGAKDAYIDIIEVDEQYRRQGVARRLVAAAEKWALENGYAQIRAWSSSDKTEAIPMWRALGYGMCPAKIWVEWCKEIVDGYYVVKRLSEEKTI